MFRLLYQSYLFWSACLLLQAVMYMQKLAKLAEQMTELSVWKGGRASLIAMLWNRLPGIAAQAGLVCMNL